MTIDEQEILRRFHRTLVREIQASSPDHLQSPFTVAEIYQNLVPYRTHRDELGIQMNADYEYALLRLLAGEGDFLVMDSPTAREEIREELESPNPNTGLYRDFAAAEVRLNQELTAVALAEAASSSEATESEEVESEEVEHGEGIGGAEFELAEDGGGAIESTDGDLGAEGSGGTPDEDSDPGVLAPVETEGSEPEEEAGEAEALSEEERLPFETCPWCKENLPQRPGVRFCPYCGSNVRLVPCPACGEELELNWRFCVACGTEVA